MFLQTRAGCAAAALGIPRGCEGAAYGLGPPFARRRTLRPPAPAYLLSISMVTLMISDLCCSSCVRDCCTLLCSARCRRCFPVLCCPMLYVGTLIVLYSTLRSSGAVSRLDNRLCPVPELSSSLVLSYAVSCTLGRIVQCSARLWSCPTLILTIHEIILFQACIVV